MPVSDESAQMRALVKRHWPHLPYDWLKWLNRKIERLKEENGKPDCDVVAIFRGDGPPITRVTEEHKPLKSSL